MNKSIRIAAAQYKFELIEQWEALREHLLAFAEKAIQENANVLLMPEYAGMQLSALLPKASRSDLQQSIRDIQPWLPKWRELNANIAKENQIWFCPGSAPFEISENTFVNRCWFYGPEGELGFQDKLIMTRFEREQWFINAGKGLQIFELPFGKIGILICYDNEFPMLARKLAELNADVILAPSCTDTRAGYHRVRIGCQARALENQLLVVQSPTVGNADWSPAVDENTGKAGFFTPPDYGLPDNGIIAESLIANPGQSQWLIQTVDLAEIRCIREQGQVLTFRDWAEQFEHR